MLSDIKGVSLSPVRGEIFSSMHWLGQVSTEFETSPKPGRPSAWGAPEQGTGHPMSMGTFLLGPEGLAFSQVCAEYCFH